MIIKNKDLINVVNFIDALKVKGLKSINRTDVSEKLKEKAQDYFNKQDLLALEYEFDKDKSRLSSELLELSMQTVSVDGCDAGIDVIKGFVSKFTSDESEEEFEGSEGLALQALYYALKLDK